MYTLKNGWQPIETAPKDRRILLGFEEYVFTGIYCIAGNFDNDYYANKPKPFWTHDMVLLRGIRAVRQQQPIAWMELPERPL